MLGLKPWTKRATTLAPRTESPLGWMGEELGPLFERFFPRWLPIEETIFPIRYPLTMEEKEKEVLVCVELPGFAREEVTVETRGEVLTIEAEHKEAVKEGVEKEGEAKKERGAYAHVKREIKLPLGVEMEKVEAFYRNGILEVHLPKKAEILGKKVEVKV